jgi:aryl-alcohol dehydrogenase-like predicted oxidoreductase
LASSLLDRRYETPEFQEILDRSNKRPRIELRGVFLQGLPSLPKQARFPELGRSYDPLAIKKFLKSAADTHADGDPMALCLRYAMGLDWVAPIVIGVDSVPQLERLVDIFAFPPLPPSAMADVRKHRPPIPRDLLDPTQWK